VVDLLRRCGEAHGGKSASQAALNRLIQRGALPIPGAKNARQAGENAGALVGAQTRRHRTA
jgi:diketogulonate reductase-like aldo/keto reductase